MKISRFFQEAEMNAGEELELSTANHRHAVQVLRLKIDQPLILFNGSGGQYHAKLTYSDKRNSRVLIEHFDSVNRESPLVTTLALATIKPDKMDFAIQKAVELGVSIIQPLYTKRSVIKIKANRLDKKMQHWQGVIIAACEQSGRTAIPTLREPLEFEKFLDSNLNVSCISMLPGNHPKITELENRESLSLLIGPEGGFTDDEEQIMHSKGVSPISFGKRILRAETAVVAGLTACQQRWGDL
ncbi:MAG: 16S rRNA (uracil(1498)-N(3))-methyltransferase [Cocleimonas sp.]